MAKDQRYDALTTFLAARGDALQRTATLLAASYEAGQDLLQEALERLVRQWPKVEGDPEGYLRRIMYNRAVDRWRIRSRRPEVLGLPDELAVEDHASGLDLRLALLAALGSLTPRQRAAVVARYWEQLTEAETAEALGCSVSAVKAAAARGLKTLRQEITPDLEWAQPYAQEEAEL